jgi:iron transport multicopper oxidase
MRATLSVLTLFYFQLAAAETVEYDWRIGWKWIAPDGVGRPVIAVNDQWPPPVIEASVGDKIVVNVKNNLGNETTSIHFHGMLQNGTSAMDGPTGATQCPIPPGSHFRYSFHVGRTLI